MCVCLKYIFNPSQKQFNHNKLLFHSEVYILINGDNNYAVYACY